MKVLFIYLVQPPKLNVLNYLSFQHGVAYLSAVLKKAGHKTEMIYNYKLDRKQIDQKIKNFNPGLIAVSTTTNQFDASKEIIKYIYKTYGLPIILGGVHATVAPEESIKVFGIIGICRGEGERALLELVEKLEKQEDYFNTNNFWFKKDNKIIKNPIKSLIQNLDELPFPDREIFDYQHKLDKTYIAEIAAGRGCPYKCSYCVNHAYTKLFKSKGRYVRMRSVDNVLKEIKELVSNYKNVKILQFQDDTFTYNKEWLKEFAEKYPKQFNLPFQCNTRADHIDKEIVDLLKKAGCTECRIGVEAGNEDIRNKVLNRGLERNKILHACKLIKEAKITLFVFNMIGSPYETPETVQDTIKINKEIKPDIVFASVFEPFPGTELYEVCKKNRWISDRKIEGFFGNETILDQPDITREEVAYYHNIFPWCILYPRFAPVIKVLSKIHIGKKSVYDHLFPLIKKIFEAKVMLVDRTWMNIKLKFKSKKL